MAEPCTLALNGDYLDTSAFPTQRSRFEKLYDGLRRRGIDPKIKRIRFEGKDNLAVIGSIARQIRGMMRDFYDGKVISFFGDSGGGPFLSAMQQNIETHPVSEDKELMPRPVIVAPGGSLNNLSRHLGTAKKSDVMGIVSGEIPFRTQEIKIRNVTVSTFDGPGDGNGGGRRGTKIAEQSSPWTCFVGAGLDGFVIHHWENQSRRSPLAVRGVKTAITGLKHLFGEKEGAHVHSDSFIAIPNMSLFYFGPEYDCLDSTHVHRISLDREGAGDVMKSFLVCMGIGLVPAVNSAVWAKYNGGRPGDYGPGFSGIADEIKPKKVEGARTVIPSSEPFIQIDGFPMDLRRIGLREGGHGEMEISTTPWSVYVARKARDSTPGLSLS